jgi:hypothetical protein
MKTTTIRAKVAAQAAIRTGWALAVLVLAASCDQQVADDPGQTVPTHRTRGSTATAPTAPGADPTVPPQANPAATQATAAEESLAIPASPTVMAAAQSLGDQATALVASVSGAKLRFTDCADQGTCSIRVETRTLSGMRNLLQALSGGLQGVGFVVRERLDAYTGKWYQADVTVNGATSVAVPADENELLVNFGDPPDPAAAP